MGLAHFTLGSDFITNLLSQVCLSFPTWGREAINPWTFPMRIESYVFGPFRAAGRIILAFVSVTFAPVHSECISKGRRCLLSCIIFQGTVGVY